MTTRFVDRPRARRALLLVAACGLALAAVGCIDHEVRLELAADGSGRLIETTVARGPMAEMMKAMAAEEEDDTEEKRADAEARAAELGEGVTFVSYEKLPEEEGLGERVVYRFADIEALRLDPAPSGDEGPSDGPSETIRFRFDEASGKKVLVADFSDSEAATDVTDAADPDAAGGESDAEADAMAEAMGEGMMEMVKPFLQGFRVRVLVDIAGSGVETTAPHAGSEVTLLELDFDRLLAQEGAWEKLSALGDDASLLQAGEALAGVDGVVIPADEVRIAFEP